MSCQSWRWETVFAVVVVMAVCSMTAVAGQGELVTSRGVFDTTLVSHRTDLSRFATVAVDSVEFQYREVASARTVVSQSELLGRGNQGPFPMSEELRAQFEEIVREALMTGLERSERFDLASVAGADTLLVEATFSDITSNLPPRVAGTYDVYLSHAGTADVGFRLVDGGSGEVLAELSEVRRIEPPSRMNQVSSVPATVASVSNDMRIWAADVAQDLLRAIERIAE